MSKKWADDYSSDEESVDANDKDLVSDDEELVALPVQQLLKRPVENNTNNNATPSTDDISFIAHVSGINFSVDRKTLGTFFETAGCLLLNVEMIEKGTALIKFGNKESLDICLKMDNTSLQGRNFRTTVFSAQEPPRKPRSDGGHRGRGFSDGKDKGGFRGGSGGRDGGRGRGRGFGDADRNRGPPAAANAKRVQSSSEAQAEAPLTRPKLNLQPRSLPVDAIGVPVVKALIFGDGRPQDEQAYEVSLWDCRRAMRSTNSHIRPFYDCRSSVARKSFCRPSPSPLSVRSLVLWRAIPTCSSLYRRRPLCQNLGGLRLGLQTSWSTQRNRPFLRLLGRSPLMPVWTSGRRGLPGPSPPVDLARKAFKVATARATGSTDLGGIRDPDQLVVEVGGEEAR